MYKFVDVDALRLRASPTLTPESIIDTLHFGQSVELVGPSVEPGWIVIKVQRDEQMHEGVVREAIEDGIKPTLRNPVSEFREALVAEAIKEWLRFDKGHGLEHEDPFYRYVGAMWTKLNRRYDGRNSDIYWSAAAISFMVANAGVLFPKYMNFKFHKSHSMFLHDSILMREQANFSAPFWGYALHERAPQIGDIVGKWRETPISFEAATRDDSFKSHTDIIVSIDGGFALAIGGNVGQSVNISKYNLTESGFIAAEEKAFMLMASTAP